MGTEVLDSEFGAMKQELWTLSSRVLLLEGFIKHQFGDVFWQFCQDQVTGESSTEEEDEKVTLPQPQMPSIIPIIQKKSCSVSSSVNVIGGKKPIPPPPPLKAGVNLQQQQKQRNFLPKGLAKPKLPSSITITPTPNLTPNPTGSHSGSRGNNGISILKEKDLLEGVNNHHHNLEGKEKGRKQQGSIPAMISRQNIRLSSGSTSSIPSVQRVQQQQQQQFVEDYGDYYAAESEESEEDTEMMYGEEGYLPAELVSATLATPEEEQDQDQEGFEDVQQAKKMRLSSNLPSSSSSTSFLSNGNAGGQRQMRPNPCHARCQNRCHDVWTDGQRMGVFQTYWSLPSEEDRREFVASRIERVDMATKRTEFSNFRTCTFKYYLPHPDNPWTQVCKNFFLATIDEKRSYIEKIAQSVKGEAAEKLSTKNIPFRRRNQMQRSLEANYAEWIQQQQAMGVDTSMLEDPDSQGYLEGEGDPGDEGEGDDGGLEMMEDPDDLQPEDDC